MAKKRDMKRTWIVVAAVIVAAAGGAACWLNSPRKSNIKWPEAEPEPVYERHVAMVGAPMIIYADGKRVGVVVEQLPGLMYRIKYITPDGVERLGDYPQNGLFFAQRNQPYGLDLTTGKVLTPGNVTPSKTTTIKTTPSKNTPSDVIPGRTTPSRSTPGGITPGRTTPGRFTPGLPRSTER